MIQKHELKYIEAKTSVDTFIARLKYTLNDPLTTIRFQRTRLCDENKNVCYTNDYTFDSLFPNRSENEVFRNELSSISVNEYIETVKDIKRPHLDHFRVFGRIYDNKDVYIKIRIGLLKQTRVTFIMSFHFSEWQIDVGRYPYRKRGNDESN